MISYLFHLSSELLRKLLSYKMLQLYKKNQGRNEHSDIVEIKGVIRALAVGPQQGRQRKK